MNYLLCQSRKSLISKLRHLLWLTASESSKIHKVFSAVHPCQPQNLLLLFHSLGFSIDLFWNWLSWVSKPTFKVPQVSVLFNFQGPAALSRFRDSLYIIYQILSFVKRFSESFLKKFSSKNGVQAVGKGSSGCRRGLGSRDSLIIIASSMTFVNRFLQVFLIFSTKFEGEVWARCILGWRRLAGTNYGVCGRWKIDGRRWEGCGPGMPGPYGVV